MTRFQPSEIALQLTRRVAQLSAKLGCQRADGLRDDKHEAIRVVCAGDAIHIRKGAYQLKMDPTSLCLLSDMLQRRPDLAWDLLASDLLALHSATLNDFVWFESRKPPTTAILALGGSAFENRHLCIREARVEPERCDELWNKLMGSYASEFAAYIGQKWLLGSEHVPLSHIGSVLGVWASGQRQSGGVFVRVDPTLTWPLALPFDHFIEHPAPPYDMFACYRFVDWIITDRLWSTAVADHRRLDRALHKREQFLSHTRFIINHAYDFWSQQAHRQVDKAVCILREFDCLLRMQSLQVIEFNPPLRRVKRILTDRSVRYVFANFHTQNDRWQTCDGEEIVLERFVVEQRLKHLELVSASHCKSIEEPRQAEGRRSICRLLLEAGVTRTGGSLLFESAQDYLCKVLYLLTDARALGPVLFESAVLAGVDFDQLADRVDAYLKDMGYRPINRDVMIG